MNQQLATKFQEQFWILNRISGNNSAYNIPAVFKLNKMPNIDRLENAVNILVKKYDVLRSEYFLEDDRVMMNIVDITEFQYKIELIKNQTYPIVGELPPELLAEIHKPFDLSKAPLFRIKIFEYPDTYYITFLFHHIIIDLRSKEIFFKELEKLYTERITEKDILTSDSAKNYSTFAKEHNEWMKSTEAKQMMQLWKNELPPLNHLLNLPISKPRQKSINFEGKRIYFKLNKDIGKQINSISSDWAITSFTFCLSAYFILLNKLSQQDRIVIGVPLTNRRNQSNNDVFGCFVNILPIEINFENNPTVRNIVKQVRNKLLLAHRKQEIPFLSLIEQEKKNRNLAYNPYFQTGFTFEPLAEINLNGIAAQSIPVEKEGAQLDMFLTMWESRNGFDGYIEYSTRLFSDSMARRIELSYKNIINEIISEKKLISEIIILSSEDKSLLKSWNNTDEEIDINKCLHQQFEEQVLATPDEVALKYNGSSLNYLQVNKHANRLSNFLIKKGVQLEDIVGISIDRSFELIIAIIAIHKAGAAYLPLDARYPKERISTIIEDGKPKIIITTSANRENLHRQDNIILIDDILSEPLSKNDNNPNIKVSSQNLAYILFTSGSTGRPKGVMIEHHSVINKLAWMQYMHPINNNESLLLKTPVTFDVSVWELFWWFFNGSSLTILPPEGEKDPNTIVETTKNNKVSTLIFVPSMFAPFVEYLKLKNAVSNLSNLKYVILIGEALSPQLVMDFNQLRTNTFSPRLVNTYGPTETTVAVSYYNCQEINPIDKVFIGRPIFNTKLFVLDKNKQICPIGVSGELVVSGENLARGYKNSPELNSSKFIKIKDLEGKSLKVYRTGDVAKWDENGELDFIRRVDNQVKIRGYRIELGDIEKKILENENVETAVVIINNINEGNKQLIAYVVLKQGLVTDSDSIKKRLMLNLPEYMVPTHVMVLDAMPLNSSEKIDRKALPKPKIESNNSISIPVSDTEKALVEIWSGLLNIEDIGITNNFFDIGGNSLLVISMVTQIKIIMDIDIEPVDIMQFPNIRELSEYLDGIDSEQTENDIYTDIMEKTLLRNENRISRRTNIQTRDED